MNNVLGFRLQSQLVSAADQIISLRQEVEHLTALLAAEKNDNIITCLTLWQRCQTSTTISTGTPTWVSPL